MHLLRHRLGLVGAFGYDLLLQFDPIAMHLPRDNAKTLHLFLCDFGLLDLMVRIVNVVRMVTREP